MSNRQTRRVFLGACAATAALPQDTPKAPDTDAPAAPAITSGVMLWTLPGSFEDRVRLAAEAGLQGVQLVDEHIKWSPAEFEKARKLISSYAMTADTIIATPDWTRRPVSIVNPQHRQAFLQDVKSSLEYAKRLDVKRVILMAGNEQPGLSKDAQWESLIEGAKQATGLAETTDVTLIVEPLNNKVDHKGFFLATVADGLRLIQAVDSPRCRLLFDLYHEHVQTGSLDPSLRDAAPFTSVYHVADDPGRHEPGTGRMEWPAIYKTIADLKFAGPVCLEFLPTGAPAANMKQAIDLMRAGAAADQRSKG